MYTEEIEDYLTEQGFEYRFVIDKETQETHTIYSDYLWNEEENFTTVEYNVDTRLGIIKVDYRTVYNKVFLDFNVFKILFENL